MSAQPQSVGAIYVYINSICTWMVGSWAKCPGLGYVTLLLAFLPRSLSRFFPFPARRELWISAQIVINDARQPAVPLPIHTQISHKIQPPQRPQSDPNRKSLPGLVILPRPPCGIRLPLLWVLFYPVNRGSHLLYGWLKQCPICNMIEAIPILDWLIIICLMLMIWCFKLINNIIHI